MQAGKALKLLPDVIISLKKSKMYDSEKHIIGNELKAITLKNRMYPPFNEATIQIDYVNGLNEFAGLAELAVKAGMVRKGGAGWYTYIKDDGSEVKAQGDEKLLKILTENKEEFIDKLNKWLADTGFSSINEELKAANDLVSQVIDND